MKIILRCELCSAEYECKDTQGAVLPRHTTFAINVGLNYDQAQELRQIRSVCQGCTDRLLAAIDVEIQEIRTAAATGDWKRTRYAVYVDQQVHQALSDQLKQFSNVLDRAKLRIYQETDQRLFCLFEEMAAQAKQRWVWTRTAVLNLLAQNKPESHPSLTDGGAA